MLTTIHRFTPPTCTLEIKGKKSPLSQWTDQDVLKKMQFRLSFDDPRLPSSQQVLLKGDRHDLESLKISVDRYMQNFLHNSLALNINIKNNHHTASNEPYLQPKGLTNHELFFGGISHDNQENKTTLTTVQLFDLVTALEAYGTHISALPQLQAKSKKVIPLWGGIAAVAIAAIGTTVLLKSPSVPNIAVSPESKPSDIPQFDNVVPPDAAPQSSKRTPKPTINESLSSTKKLPPPPAVDAPKPKPDIPDPADYPLSQVARQSGLQQSREKSPVAKIPASTPQLETKTKPEQEELAADNSSISSSSETDIADSDNNLALKDTPSSDQLKEIKAYFQEQWQPPADLKQSLEYRLYINNDGSIKRVVSIGKASELYLSQTNIPVKGEAFISPRNESQQSTIRLLLNPDGGVKTFAE